MSHPLHNHYVRLPLGVSAVDSEKQYPTFTCFCLDTPLFGSINTPPRSALVSSSTHSLPAVCPRVLVSPAEMSEPGHASTIPGALAALMQVFDHHAAQDEHGPKDKLSKKELKKLIETELTCMVEKGDDAKLNEMFSFMDMDGDGQVDFEEFMMVLACFACICHGREYELKAAK
ncbi:protein S100-A1-like [Boleophthalmus pectinirostris]|uniref:protein S100-A1-like n=1 Tax=Boleophthalmus pectinirostris TaxID=150288 RepID=UPI00242B4AD7|nr:protein S100-A1-like [Boleophthalmus pectinirostris]